MESFGVPLNPEPQSLNRYSVQIIWISLRQSLAKTLFEQSSEVFRALFIIAENLPLLWKFQGPALAHTSGLAAQVCREPFSCGLKASKAALLRILPLIEACREEGVCETLGFRV